VAEVVYPAVIGLARVVFRVQGLRFTLQGTEHVPRQGGAVMVINHIGYMDFTYAGLAAQPAKRLVRFMAKNDVFDHRISGPLMRGMHHISVDREAGSASFREALTALKNGEIVGVFPEATISRSFQLKEFKAGAVRMAAAARVPLLPAVIWGSQRVWTKDHPKQLGRTKTPITIRVGEPITVPPKADMAEVTDVLRDRMTTMLHEVQQQYPDRPSDPAQAWWLPADMGGGAPTPEQAAQLDADERESRARSRGADSAG
jgi:1-acyl-sn-glycerol-3-phosphate acyltransferase